MLPPFNDTLDELLCNEVEQLNRKRQFDDLFEHADGGVADEYGFVTWKRRKTFGSGNSDALEGDVALAELRRALDQFEELSPEQVMFTEMFTQTNLPGIYKKDFAANEYRILKANGVESMHQYASISCPRRFGKSHVTARYCAAHMVAVPDAKILVFAPAKRQAGEFMDSVRVALRHLKDRGFNYQEVDGENNKEKLSIIVNGNRRSIQGLPAKEVVRFFSMFFYPPPVSLNTIP